MQSNADTKSKNLFRFFSWAILTAVLALTLSFLASHRVSAQEADVLGTNIGVTICGPESSQISLTQPVSDSVVTVPTVTLEGTVSQASQLEITVDGTPDSIIPLDMGQTNFTGSVQLAPGTHTIEVTAVNICAGGNGTATAVVTYTVPPQTPSTGEETPTTVGGVIQGGSIDAVGESKGEELSPLGQLLKPIEGIAKWLNVDFGVEPQEGLSMLSVSRAVTLTVGMYLSVIGVAPALIMQAASIPVVATVLHIDTAALPRRLVYLSRIGRIIGIGLVLGALFL